MPILRPASLSSVALVMTANEPLRAISFSSPTIFFLSSLHSSLYCLIASLTGVGMKFSCTQPHHSLHISVDLAALNA